MSLSAQHIATAAKLWLGGRDTVDIAKALDVHEAVVAACLPEIRETANRSRSRFHAH